MPGFRNSAGKDYTLAGGSPCIGVANASVYGLPGKEYFQNEITNCQWRIRLAARDIGAFESTSTNSPIGPYDPLPRPLLGIMTSGANAIISWPLFAQDFQLDQSLQISGAAWTAAPYLYHTDVAAIAVSAPANGSNSFFRLRK